MLSKLEAASSLLLGLALVPQAAAHGHVSGITIDGTLYVSRPAPGMNKHLSFVSSLSHKK